ncbi:hypothetical protein CC85DRAFT_288504 [Cutaneotrichosporon oleaginosum]|uniref:BTB domain-containing protein n=1 Tax=Cutaneotrichosporon oleaginosum TaxID=879819 RepID=A0A0J0XEH0_9TREE|nr:uncharacterized protein CC85DRAFT_288504 [Cutaneotrichosporon oleaginosum]KLT39448.1 hypothetical protein CC85DRAFT_288504 [Cutaneotrichosporon oleaginosum]TXT09955.1 hypothetical protein COLE_03889 [Cutaneotrichosporon oleaginosum]
MATRWNPDNPTPTPFTPTQSIRGRNDASTPTPSRRTNSIHLPSTAYVIPPVSRHTHNQEQARAPHTNLGFCETKQTAFEWPVKNVRELKIQLEKEAARGRGEDAPEDDERHEILAGDETYFDDLSYKLHLERAPDTIDEYSDGEGVQEPRIILAIIATWAKYSDIPADGLFAREVFVGLKHFELPGERMLGEPEWLWSQSAIATFSKRQEYHEVVLPPLSVLLDDPGVLERDSFSIRIVVKHASEVGLPPLVHSDQQFVSRRVTRMNAALLDSQRTGDVRFICLEHQDGPASADYEAVARRRIVYAHWEMLVHAEYFKATLAGGFSEASDATMTTLVVDDAAFNTVYWVLRWLYTDEILFTSTDSVRAVMSQVRVDRTAARRLLSSENWDFVPLEEEDDIEARTVRSVSSVGTAPSAGRRSPRHGPVPSAKSEGSASRRPSAASSSTSTQATPRPGISRTKSSSPVSTVPRIASTPRKPALPALGKAAAKLPSTAPTSPAAVGRSPYPSGAPRRPPPPAEPHKHPTVPPTPPSPLAVFFLAHRYGLDELQALARDALLRQLTPSSCVAALLATFSFFELHQAIMDYVIDHWAEVCASPELERCYQEVSAGVWGENDGGQVLLGLTRRLTGV